MTSSAAVDIKSEASDSSDTEIKVTPEASDCSGIKTRDIPSSFESAPDKSLNKQSSAAQMVDASSAPSTQLLIDNMQFIMPTASYFPPEKPSRIAFLSLIYTQSLPCCLTQRLVSKAYRSFISNQYLNASVYDKVRACLEVSWRTSGRKQDREQA